MERTHSFRYRARARARARKANNTLASQGRKLGFVQLFRARARARAWAR